MEVLCVDDSIEPMSEREQIQYPSHGLLFVHPYQIGRESGVEIQRSVDVQWNHIKPIRRAVRKEAQICVGPSGHSLTQTFDCRYSVLQILLSPF